MTVEQITALNIPISPLNNETILLVESAFLWINENTTLEYDLENLPETIPPNVRLFIVKYYEVMSANTGIASESIQGLSQSFNNADRGLLLRQYANELLGGYMRSAVVAVQAFDRWC